MGSGSLGDYKKLKKIYIFDSTLRDGAQAEGVSFTVEDKLKIVRKLDSIRVDYIEAGNPGSNPKDLEFFQKVKRLGLSHSKITAFGSTRRANIRVEEDANVLSLLDADTGTVAIFGKTWDLHVTDIIHATLEENIEMIKDTIAFMKYKGKEVVFDAEHFYDGFKSNAKYAADCLKAAVESGADWVVLCDTNGGTMPNEIRDITKEVVEAIDTRVGIHCHNDGGMAVANSIIAVLEGAVHVQGTMNGYGERCGNANLCTIIPNLFFKLNYSCLSPEYMNELTSVSRYVSELANNAHDERAPYVGNSAFAHKGGMHIDGVMKNPKSFEHIPPEMVGGNRRFLMSEVSGRSTIITRIQKIEPGITKDSEVTYRIIDELKRLEHEGYQFEGAESSFELLIMEALGKNRTYFEVLDFKVICIKPDPDEDSASATIKVRVGSEIEMTAAEGDGPVNALDKALRKALEVFYPELSEMRLVDYKVRVLDTEGGTSAKVRVHIESSDGECVWGTVGVSTNIIEASLKALVDSIQYMLLKQLEQPAIA